MENNRNYEILTVPGTPELEVLYAQAKAPYKGCILCVHGICHGAWCFENFLSFFSDNGYDCYALSLRGHAGSSGHENLNDYTLSDYSQDIKNCIAHFKQENRMKSDPFLLGHSMGGAIVQKYMGDYAETINGAILFAPATAGGMGPIEQLKPIFKNGIPDGSKILNLINKNIPISPEVMARSAFFSNRIAIEAIAHYNNKLHNESKKAINNLGKPYTNNYNIDIPIMVIGSKADAYFPEKSLRKTANTYKCAENNKRRQLKILEDLCHDMMLDPKWERSAKAVLEFMENNK